MIRKSNSGNSNATRSNATTPSATVQPGSASPEASSVSLLLSRLTQRTREAIETACRIAQEEQRALAGIFVEDVELLHAATYPFTRALDPVTAGMRPIDASDVERSFIDEARAVAQLVNSVAARHKVPASFRVARGTLLDQARREARPGRVVVAAAAGVGASGSSRTASSGGADDRVVTIAASPDASRAMLDTLTRALPPSTRLTVCLFEPEVRPVQAEEIEQACQRVESLLGRKVQWMRPDIDPGLATIEAMLDTLRPGIIGLAPEVLESQLARITSVLRRLGGTLILRE